MSLSTPGIKQPKGASVEPLNAKDRDIYRSNTMRAAYLALDRPELQFSTKELARNMQAPTVWGYVPAETIGTFFIGSPTTGTEVQGTTYADYSPHEL